MDANQSYQNYGQADSELADTNSILYGSPFQDKLPTIFIVGNKESNFNPGTGPRENNKLHKEWADLKAIAFGPSQKPWRRMLSSSFDTYAIYSSKSRKKSKATPDSYVNVKFTVGGRTWLSVTHYLLSMLYRNSPEYSILFSYDQKSNKEGFWGHTETALNEHRKNMSTGKYGFDPDFMANLPGYYFEATFAKITQNPILKEILLATEDAYLAERYGDIVVGLPTLMYIRELIKNNPKLVYLGQGMEPAMLDDDDAKKILNPYLFNYGFDETILSDDRLAGDVTASNLYPSADPKRFLERKNLYAIVNREAVSENSWIYMFVRPIDVVPDDIMAQFSARKFIVERNVYGIRRVHDSLKDLLIVGVETTPCSQTRMYIKYQLADGTNFYFEPMEGDLYTMFITSIKYDPSIVTYMSRLEPEQQEPPGMTIVPYELPSLVKPTHVDFHIGSSRPGVRQLLPDPLTYEQVVYQYFRIEEFLTSKRINGMNAVIKMKVFTALRDELVLRSFSNGERLLSAPGSLFVKEFSSEFGLLESWVKSFFGIDSYPTDPQNNRTLPEYLSKSPIKELSLKQWILYNSLVIDTTNYYRIPRAWVEIMNTDHKIDDEVFGVLRFKDVDRFRGFYWMDKLPDNVDPNIGVRWLCEVPSQKQIEMIFIERLDERLREALTRQIPLEVIIISRSKGPLYDWIIKDNRIVLRKVLKEGTIQQNPFTGKLSPSNKPRILVVARSHENFFKVDLAKINNLNE